VSLRCRKLQAGPSRRGLEVAGTQSAVVGGLLVEGGAQKVVATLTAALAVLLAMLER
jgi:hypothetical protein